MALMLSTVCGKYYSVLIMKEEREKKKGNSGSCVINLT